MDSVHADEPVRTKPNMQQPSEYTGCIDHTKTMRASKPRNTRTVSLTTLSFRHIFHTMKFGGVRPGCIAIQTATALMCGGGVGPFPRKREV